MSERTLVQEVVRSLIAVSVLSLLFISLTQVHAAGTAADLQCPKPDGTHVYAPSKPATWIEVEGPENIKMYNLYGKKCSDTVAGKPVTGICVAYNTCKATSYTDLNGKQTSLGGTGAQKSATTPSSGGASGSSGGSGGTSQGGATPSTGSANGSGSITNALSGSGSGGTTPSSPGSSPSTNQSSLDEMLYNPTPISENKSLPMQSVDSNSLPASSFSPTPSMQQQVELTPAATPDGMNSVGVETTIENGAQPMYNPSSFSDQNPQSDTQSNTFQQGGGNDSQAPEGPSFFERAAAFGRETLDATGNALNELFGVGSAEAKPGTISKGACLANPDGCLGPTTGEASYYDSRLGGINSSGLGKTANGEVPDMTDTAFASQTLPLNTVAQVCNNETGDCVYARVNDTGDFNNAKYNYRIADLTPGTAEEINMNGKANVTITPVGIYSSGDMASAVTDSLNEGKSLEAAVYNASQSTGGSPVYTVQSSASTLPFTPPVTSGFMGYGPSSYSLGYPSIGYNSLTVFGTRGR